jgi:NADH-quinone oxidoreductase subunit K
MIPHEIQGLVPHDANIPLSWFLALSVCLFCIGIFCVLSRRNAIGILMGIELMLNAANINLVAFARYLHPNVLTGQIFAIFVLTIAAAEAAVGLAIVISVYRNREQINVDELDVMKW